MVQQIIIGVLFLAALFSLGRIVWRSFQSKSGCATNCGKCTPAADALEKVIKS